MSSPEVVAKPGASPFVTKAGSASAGEGSLPKANPMPDTRLATGGRGHRHRHHGHSRSHRLRAQAHPPQGCLQLRRAPMRGASCTRPEHQPQPGHRRPRIAVSRATEGPRIWIRSGLRRCDHGAGCRTATHHRNHCRAPWPPPSSENDVALAPLWKPGENRIWSPPSPRTPTRALPSPPTLSATQPSNRPAQTPN